MEKALQELKSEGLEVSGKFLDSPVYSAIFPSYMVQR